MTEPPQASGSVVCNQKFVGSFKVHMVYSRRTINQPTGRHGYNCEKFPDSPLWCIGVNCSWCGTIDL